MFGTVGSSCLGGVAVFFAGQDFGYGEWSLRMGPAPSYRLLHSLFLPPLPSTCFISLTACGTRKCASIRGAFGTLQLQLLQQPWRRSSSSHPGYLPNAEHVGALRLRGESGFFYGRSGFACVRNSRSDHGVVGSSWTKGGGAASENGHVEKEQVPRSAKVSPRSKSAGGASNKKAEKEDASSRSGKEAEAGGESPRVKAKRGPDKAWSKFKRATHFSSRSYSSSGQAKPSERVQGASGGDVPSNSEASSVQNGTNQGKPGSGDAKKSRGKNKQYAPEQDLRRQLDMCSKYADVKQALEIYDKFKAESEKHFNQYNYNIVLYLCSSAASNSLKPQKSGNERRGTEQQNQPRGPLDELSGNLRSKNGAESATAAESEVLADKERIFYMNRGFEVHDAMRSQGVPPNEATFTAVARLAVAKEDGDLAFEMVKQMAKAKLTPRLRSYSPALYTYCKLKNHEKAFEVDEHMKEAGVTLEESELEALLKLSVDASLEDKVYSLLHRLRTTVRDVSPSVVEVIQQWFTSSAGANAGKLNWDSLPSLEAVKVASESCGGGWNGLGWLGKGTWEVKSSVVDGHGVCQECGEQLVTIDLDPQETEMFARSLSKLACHREAKNNEFKKFIAWLDRNGPYDAIVDGANVGLYNSNSGNGGFNFYQLNNVVTGIQTKLGFKKEPLILLHHRRTKGGPAASSFATRALTKWMDTNSIYTTPTGSNDDWYWLYAAVRYRCLLVTNDEMRDHLFSLLGDDFFPKWKERHQVRFTVNQDGLTFHMPPPYSTVIQESEKGSWHIPKSSNDDDVLKPREWMCVTRVGLPTPSEKVTSTEVEKLEGQSTSSEKVTATEVENLEEQPTPPKGKPAATKKSRLPKSSALQASEVKKLEEEPAPPKRKPSATKKSRLPKSSAPKASEVEKLEEQPTLPKRKPSTTKKSRSPKSSALQASEVKKLEEEPAPPKRKPSATKKSRLPKTSVLFQKLEAAEKVRSGDSIDFEI